MISAGVPDRLRLVLLHRVVGPRALLRDEQPLADRPAAPRAEQVLRRASRREAKRPKKEPTPDARSEDSGRRRRNRPTHRRQDRAAEQPAATGNERRPAAGNGAAPSRSRRRTPRARSGSAGAEPMEWIEVTAKSLDEAVELALDRLGVVADELEYEVLDEPRSGLFGRLGRADARIRARVKPLSREKPADRRRRRRGSERSRRRSAAAAASTAAAAVGSAGAAARAAPTAAAGRGEASAGSRRAPAPRAGELGDGEPATPSEGHERTTAGARRRRTTWTAQRCSRSTNRPAPRRASPTSSCGRSASTATRRRRGRGRRHRAADRGRAEPRRARRAEGRDAARARGAGAGGRAARGRRAERPPAPRRRRATASGAGRRWPRSSTQVADEVRDSGHRAGARADEPARPQGRARHGRRARRRGDDVGGRGAPPPGRDQARRERRPAGADDRARSRLSSNGPASTGLPRPRARSTRTSRHARGFGDGRRASARRAPGPRVVDLGSGGGVPGTGPRRRRGPSAAVILVEAARRRAADLEAAVGELLGVGDRVAVVDERAEDVGPRAGVPGAARARDGPELRRRRR